MTPWLKDLSESAKWSRLFHRSGGAFRRREARDSSRNCGCRVFRHLPVAAGRGSPAVIEPLPRFSDSWFTRLSSLSHLKTLRFKFAPLGSSRYGLRTLGTLELSCVQQEQEDSFMNKDQVS